MLLRYIEICSKITLKNDRLNDLAQYIFKKMFYYRDEVTYQFGEKKRNKNWFEIIEMIVLIIAHIGKC